MLAAGRHAFHALAERKSDRYLRDLSESATEWLGVERLAFERSLLQAARTIDACTEARLAGDRLLPGGLSTLVSRFRDRQMPARTPSASSYVRHGEGDLAWLLEALEGAHSAGLDPLPSSDWLARLLPDWEVLRGLPHVAPFHRHPVDVHSWCAVDEIRFAMTEDTEGTGTPEAARQLPDRSEVLLAALLHDIGKGHPGDHRADGRVIARVPFANRAGLDAEAAQRLSEAARLHLLLPMVATRRDIAVARVTRETAEQVGDARMLHLLYLISVADARASGPDVWSP
ncbi:MAG: HD domain-containing protein [Dehalococcoidia bacterium]|nr:HD domain-containing protein [Dehalococcoidia bacterium]